VIDALKALFRQELIGGPPERDRDDAGDRFPGPGSVEEVYMQVAPLESFSRKTRRPLRVRRGPIGLGLAAGTLAFLAGCNFQQPKYEVGDQRLLLVPFSDHSVKPYRGYGESTRGKSVVDCFRNWAESNADPQFSDPRDTEIVVKSLREWTKPKITPVDWRQLLAGTDADLVLIGDIIELQLQDPKTIGMLQGTIRGKYSLIKASSGRPVYESTEFTREFPKLNELDAPIREFGARPQDIERGLIRIFGEQIGKDLYGYYPETR
jgi:hypothetical protein